MGRKRSWTILFVPDDQGGPRQVHLGPGAVRLIIGLGIFAVLLAGVGAATYWKVARVALEAQGLKNENALLLQEVEKVWDLEQDFTDMLEMDFKIRTQLGLEFPADWPGYRYQLAPGSDSTRAAPVPTALASEYGSAREGEEGAGGGILFAWPVTQGFPTSEFGEGTATGSTHTGLDIAAKVGTQVRAAYDGTVVVADFEDRFGNLVEIDHGGGLVTRYGHNARLVVHQGQVVKKGDIIAYVGSSGKVTTGPHLHFEVLKDGRSLDPRRYLPKL